jgi:hypothetical protein
MTNKEAAMLDQSPLYYDLARCRMDDCRATPRAIRPGSPGGITLVLGRIAGRLRAWAEALEGWATRPASPARLECPVGRQERHI